MDNFHKKHKNIFTKSQLEVHYDNLGRCFGILRKSGSFNKKIKVVSLNRVLHEGIDIAKFDCEGAEFFLCSIPNKILRQVPTYIMEVHGEPDPLVNKFNKAGFRVNLFIRNHNVNYPYPQSMRDILKSVV